MTDTYGSIASSSTPTNQQNKSIPSSNRFFYQKIYKSYYKYLYRQQKRFILNYISCEKKHQTDTLSEVIDRFVTGRHLQNGGRFLTQSCQVNAQDVSKVLTRANDREAIIFDNLPTAYTNFNMYVTFYDDSRHFCTYFSTGKMWDDSAVILDKKMQYYLHYTQ
jgi:hypothetical protein